MLVQAFQKMKTVFAAVWLQWWTYSCPSLRELVPKCLGLDHMTVINYQVQIFAYYYQIHVFTHAHQIIIHLSHFPLKQPPGNLVCSLKLNVFNCNHQNKYQCKSEYIWLCWSSGVYFMHFFWRGRTWPWTRSVTSSISSSGVRLHLYQGLGHS